MPYTNLIFFVLALLVYFTYAPYGEGNLPRFLASLFIVMLGYALFVRIAYRSLWKRLKDDALPLSKTLAMIGSLEQRFMVLALFLFFYLIYGAGFKEIVFRIPLVEKSSLLELIIGFSPFAGLLIILWANAYSIVQASAEGAATRKAFILAQIKLNGPILLPVFLFSSFLDIVALFWRGEGEPSELTTSFEPFIFIPFLLLLVMFFPLLLRRMWGCYPMPPGDRRNAIEASCRKAGLNVAEIFLWPSFFGKSLTAGIAGVVGRFRYLFITPGLLNLLNDKEMEAVIAHEAGHIRRGHVFYYMLIFLLLPLALLIFSDLIALGAYGFDDLIEIPAEPDSFDPLLLSISLLGVLGGFVLVYLRVFFGLLSRNFEREADLFIFDVVGDPQGLISSLEKISYFGGYAKDAPSWHHFGIGERIRFLETCRNGRRNVAAHRRRAKSIKALFATTFVVAMVLAIVLSAPRSREAIKTRLLEAKIERLLRGRIEDPKVLMGLALGLQEAKRYAQSIAFYERILERYPENEVALNNLAWLCATAEDERILDKHRALDLAQRAADLKKEAYILDTLAEAYYVNGMRQKALEVIEEAIALKPENIDYYLGQRERFMSTPQP